jgi:hypothetical protein
MDQAKPSQAKQSQAKPSQAKPRDSMVQLSGQESAIMPSTYSSFVTI